MIKYSKIASLKSESALMRFIKAEFNGDVDLFVNTANKSISGLLHIDIKKAVRLAGKISVLSGFLPKSYQARILAIQARCSHWTGSSSEALKLYGRAIKMMRDNRDFERAAQAGLGLMDVYMYLGKYPLALETGKSALRYFRRRGNKNQVARILTNLGNIHHRLDNNRLALRYYDRAAEIFGKEAESLRAIVDYNRANIFANLGDLNRAARLYRETADIYRTYNSDINAVKAEYSRAYLYFLEDKYTQALSGLEKSIEDFRGLGDERSSLAGSLDLAEINLHLHQYGSSLSYSQEVINLYRDFGMRYEEGKAACFACEALRNLGDYGDARKYLKRAEKIFVREDNQLWLGMTGLLRSKLQYDQNRYKEALKNAALAGKHFKRSRDERRTIDAKIARIAAGLKSTTTRKPLSLAQRLLNNGLISYQRFELNNILGQYYLETDEYAAALPYLKDAIATAEKMLYSLYPDELRFFFALGKQQAYLSAVECLIKLKRYDQSFLLNTRALALLNQKQPKSRNFMKNIPRKYLETRSQLRAALKNMQRLPDTGHRSPVSLSGINTVEEKIWRNEKKIRYGSYPRKEEAITHAVDLKKLCAGLKQGEVLVNFLIIGDAVGAFLAAGKHIKFISCPVTGTALAEAVRELHFLMERQVYYPSAEKHSLETQKNYLRRLYDWLIAPLGLVEKNQKIILLVDGVFAQIPFGALSDSRDQWLFNTREISLICNPEDLIKTRSKPDYGDGENSSIFMPDNSGLPMVLEEGSGIAGLFSKVNTFQGDQATCKALSHQLAKCRGFVHIATHASRSCENPLFSRIVMSDGPFYPFDLFGTEINSSLITLSGCQTAAPGVYYGNSFSLAKAFYQAGARFVLASLWPISDKISAVFMRHFYRELHKSKDITRAYKCALAETCAINNNPAFWSPFVILGI